MSVLVAHASKYGSTQEIAEAIGRELQRHGLESDVLSVSEVEDVQDYNAVVLGSAIYMGRWLGSAREFVTQNAGELAARPTWLFSSGPIGEPLRPAGDHAVQIDEIVEETQARDHRIFPGRLDKSRLGGCERALVLALGVKEGDYRNESAVSAWAQKIAAVLELQPSSNPSSRA